MGDTKLFTNAEHSNLSFTKRSMLGYLILLDSLLLLALTFIAIQVRQVGVDFRPSENGKVFALLFLFPILWLCCLSLFGAWDATILDDHINGYRRLLKSSLMTFLAFTSASYLFKIQISRFVILFSLVGGTVLHLILRWLFLRIYEKRINKSAVQERWLVISKNGKSTPDIEKFATQFGAKLTFQKSFEVNQSFKIWADEVLSDLKSSHFTRLLIVNPETLNEFQSILEDHLGDGVDFLE